MPQSEHAQARDALHRVAAHVLARRRFEVSGRFGLRASPGGLATPAFGDSPEVVRLSGLTLVREVAATSTYVPVAGSTLRDLVAFAGADLDAAFSCGADTPGLGDVDAPLAPDIEAVTVIVDWYALAWRVLDAVVADLPAGATPATIQLWPEHFDAATDVGLASAERVNLGFSPGDAFSAEPYAYVGPWGAQRPGDETFWNAPFGAFLRRSEARASAEPATACQDFMRAGLRLLGGA